uniref:PHD-type domain-containing protein n=1 Tax=Ciona savignyi TaxID=51511 RepID=H2ZCM5_CIOSA
KSKSEKTKAKSVEQPKQVVVTSIRRSARSNKGIGKEIFDPSHIPKSAAKRYSLPPPERVERSPSSERSPSPVSSTTSVQSRKRELESPRRGSPRVKEVAPKKKPELHSPPKKKSKEIKQPSPKVTPEVKKKNKKEIEEKMEVSDEEEDKQDKEDDSPEISEDSDSDDSYNNPNRLWCICRKPHNNRFMISCDICEDWFHGDCVGITLQRGKKMEEKHQEYVCPNCLQKSKKDTREKRK